MAYVPPSLFPLCNTKETNLVHRAAPLQTAWPASGETSSAPSRARRSVLFATRSCRPTRSSPTRSAGPAITRFIGSACLSGFRTAGETRVLCAGIRLSTWGLIRSGGRIRGGEGHRGPGGGLLLVDRMIPSRANSGLASQRPFTTVSCGECVFRVLPKMTCSRSEASWENGCQENAPEVMNVL